MLRPYHVIRILRRHDATLATDRGAALIQHHVHREPVQPRAERAVAAKRGELVPQSDEDVLGALFSVPGVARQPQARRVDPARMLAIQLPEGPRIASGGAGDEIVRGGHVTRTPLSAAAFGWTTSRQADPPAELLLQLPLQLI